MQAYFYELADELTAALQGDEVLLLSFSAEDSDFVRFNRSAVRQAGSVSQRVLEMELIVANRHLRSALAVSRRATADRAAALGVLSELRDGMEHVPEDPHLLYATEPRSTESVRDDLLGDAGEAVEQVLAAGHGRDLVGIYAAGAVYAGFANSLGQRNWLAAHSFHLDWSFYHAGDKAVKSSYAGFEWDPAALERKVEQAAGQLAALDRPARTVPPGEYRAYLAPAAMAELMHMLCWGGFGMKAHRTKTTSLLKMIEGGASLAPSVTMRENTAEGMAPPFQSAGFVKPPSVTLIDGGRCADCLVGPRSAREYGAAPNGASDGETPESLDMAAGDLPQAEVLARLGEGVYVNNLWYLNYSDRPACRITGMTRFATFWVEGGQIAAPLNVMRFDETIYRLLGSNLLGLTAERDFLPDSHTYGGRSTDSMRLPGALIDKFRFTL